MPLAFIKAFSNLTLYILTSVLNNQHTMKLKKVCETNIHNIMVSKRF